MLAGKSLTNGSEVCVTYKLRSMDVLSVAKLSACLYGTMALIFIPFVLIIGVAGALSGQKGAGIGAIAMIPLAVLVPIVYAVLGFLFGALFAWLYNVFAGKLGGIELRLDVVASAPVGAGPVV